MNEHDIELNDAGIVDAWVQNAESWINVIEQNKIESRQITNQAIIKVVVDLLSTEGPDTSIQSAVLDLGCGEGWLCRELALRGLRVTGVDAVPALINQARRKNIGSQVFIDFTGYKVFSYEQIAEGKLTTTFDAVICNFSLLGEQSVKQLFSMIHTLLNPNGLLIIQTLHPDKLQFSGSKDEAWQTESWQGFDEPFPVVSPWFSRTQDQWQVLFQHSQLTLLENIEPRHPQTNQLMSLILVGRLQTKL